MIKRPSQLRRIAPGKVGLRPKRGLGRSASLRFKNEAASTFLKRIKGNTPRF